MQVEVKITDDAAEPRAVIYTKTMTDEVAEAVKKLSCDAPQRLTGFVEDGAVLLEEDDIVRIYAENGRIYAAAKDGTYTLRLRLYELEAQLDPTRFVRISNSEIINLKKVRRFDLSFAGTIRVLFLDGTSAYVSRRYVAKIKQVLGL